MMEGLALNKFIYCCGFKQICKIYNLPSLHGGRKVLLFLDECAICKRSIAIIQINNNGTIKTIKRCSGNKAVQLRDKLSLKILKFNNIKIGTLDNERRYYNNFGVIYNFNNKRIATNEEFCAKKKENHENK